MPATIVDSRRLTGANLHDRAPGAVLELRFAASDGASDGAEQVAAMVASWRAALAEGLATLAWTARVHSRQFHDHDGRIGVELMFTAPVDQLYAATELGEWALARVGALAPEPDRDPAPGSAEQLAAIVEAAAREQAERRGAVALIAAAEARGVMALIDDDELSLGQYGEVVRWPVAGLPEPEALDWARFHRRPIALITGTNGKTTTTRLLARILSLHGLRVGNTSTDGLFVGERLIEDGDWTGPGGARAIVRRPDIDVALLEAARGGLLRRGVGVPWADVAVITNVARDHLGEFGVFDVEGMAAGKGVVTSVVDPGGRIVLGAESPAVVAWADARRLPAPIVWFGLDPADPVLRAAVEGTQAGAAGEVWTVVDGALARIEGGAGEGGGERTTSLCPIAAMPLSLAGRARYNVANALAAAAAARALGVGDATITAALRSFGSEPDDNPGRAQLWRVPGGRGQGIRVFLDFAHNPAGLAAITELVRSLTGPGERLAVGFGMAGDRSDDELRELGTALLGFDPSFVLLREQPDYMRGRALGEVPGLLDQGLRAGGYDPARIDLAASEVASIERAVELGADVIVILVHTEREAVAEWLRAHSAEVEPAA
jgi:cyanophycin synthetase